jgi:hypothetical protein
MLSVTVLSVIVLSVIVLSVIVLNVIVLSVIVLSDIVLYVVMLSAMAPFYSTRDKHTSLLITFSIREAKTLWLIFFCQ